MKADQARPVSPDWKDRLVHESLIRPSYLPVSECPDISEPVDAVYTWVNGSDPDFVQSMQETDLGMKTNSLDISPQRYKGLRQNLLPHIFSFSTNSEF